MLALVNHIIVTASLTNNNTRPSYRKEDNYQVKRYDRPKKSNYFRNDQAYLQESSPIILHNTTIQHLRELQTDLPLKTYNKIDTFDKLIIELIKSYRNKKNLGTLWNED